MQVDRPQGRGRSTGVRVLAAFGGVAVLVSLAACTSAKSDKQADQAPAGDRSTRPASTASSAPSTPASTAPATPAIITTSAITAKTVNPTTPVTISIAHGTLTSVTMLNPAGKKVAGAMAADGSSWHNTADLGYSKTYSITAVGKNADGIAVTKKSKVTTLTPGNMTDVSLDRTGDYALTDGATYGVAILPEMKFDEEIVGKAAKLAAEKAITVTTSPHVDGAWAWQDNSRMLYRPQSYWPAGTKVTIAANVYGVKLGDGLYGQADKHTSFTVGRRQVTVADDNAPHGVDKVRVYNGAGKVIKTMNTSMGEHSGETVNGNYINFYTLDGTYTVLDHEQPAKMCSASYGLPADAPGGYACEDIYNATKISVDGIYLHELTTTIWAQNSGVDVSHGCLNLNTANSLWYFDHSIVGDPVTVNGAKGAPKLEVWQGGGWSVPWSVWTKGDLTDY
jgi:lipoprotein-anchoring transpeptidase ErfK/SrfK